MIRRLIAACVAVLAVAIAVPATASAQTAQRMSAYCKTVAESDHASLARLRFKQQYGDGICVGFFWAILGAAGDLKGAETDARPLLRICRPENTSVIQMVKVYRKYVQTRPEEGQENAFMIAVKALTAAYPCTTPGQ